MSAPPDVVRWTPRSNDHGDCGVVAIAMATGLTYEETLSACLTVTPEVLHAGLESRHIRAILALLGYRTRRRTKFDLDDDTGLLWVEDTKKEPHLVYLWAGRVINPSTKESVSALWKDPDDYLKTGGWTAVWLFTLEDK